MHSFRNVKKYAKTTDLYISFREAPDSSTKPKTSERINNRNLACGEERPH